jgi:hypothetical protein
MDRRTFMKVAALAPSTVSGLLAGSAPATPAPDLILQAYPVMYGPPISNFKLQELLGKKGSINGTVRYA